MLLCHISLLPVTESVPLDYSLFTLENSSHSNDVNFNGIPCCAESVRSLVNSQVSGSFSSLHMSHSVVSPEVSFGVPVCNSFTSLYDECATPAAVLSNSGDEESKKQRSLGGSDHSLDDLEVFADLTMHLSSRQEFPLAMSGNKFERQQEKTHGGKRASSEAYSVSITCNALNCVKSQALNPKASQQHPVQLLQSSTQKPRPPNATPTTKPADHEQSKGTINFTYSATVQRDGESRGQPDIYSIDYN